MAHYLGTFETGQARPDKRGSIRRGDIELPIVDETRVRESNAYNSHNESGVHKQHSLSKNQVDSRNRLEKIDVGDSPRYVDHNKLFPEDDAEERPVVQDNVSKGSVGDNASGTEKKKENTKRPSVPRVTHGADEQYHRNKPKGEGSGQQRHDPEQGGRTQSNGDHVNKPEKRQRKEGSHPSSKTEQSQKGVETHNVSPPESFAGRRSSESTKDVAQDSQHKSKQGERHQALARLKAREKAQHEGDYTPSDSQNQAATTAENTDNITATNKSTNNSAIHFNSTSSSAAIQTTKQEQRTPTINIQQASDSDNATKDPSSNQFSTTTKQQHQQHQKIDSGSHTQDRQLQQVHPSKPDSSLKTFQQAFPHSESNPYLLSTQETSTPPKDHNIRNTNNTSTNGLQDQRNKEKTNATDSSIAGTTLAQNQSKGASKMADETQRGGKESLAQVATERDQLLRNEKTYKQRILQLEDEVKSVVKQSQELSSENKMLQSKLEAFETKVYGGSLEMKELRREKQDLITKLSTETGERQKAQEEVEHLKSRLSEADHKSKQWDAIYIENNKLKTKQAELEKRLQDLENEKLKLKSNLTTAESSQMDKLNTVQNENKKLQAEILNLQTKVSSMERQTERLKSENKELADRLDQKKTELDELMRAMTTQTSTEVELKEVKQELDFAMNKITDYKKDQDESNHRYEVLEKEKDAAKNTLRLKESECKSLKANVEEKDTQIGELKRQVDTAKRNVKRLEDDLEDTKQVEKDSVNMKARIRSLKNEIEDSLAANHKMKQEKTEARLESDRLNRELATTSEALSEARRYIKKLEGHRASKDTLEDEVKTRKQREQALESQVQDLNVRNEQLKTMVQNLEEDKMVMQNNRSDITDLEAANRKLQEENKKLRQMLVERNMEIAQRQSERSTLVNRVDNLERKQVDSDIKVQQLKGWVDGVYSYTAMPANELHSDLYQHPHPVINLPPVQPKAPKGTSKAAAGGGIRRKKGQQRPQQHRENQLNRSWEDLNRLKVEAEESIRTTPGLPGVMESTNLVTISGPAQPGYFDLYKSKMKLIRERKW